MTIDTKKTLIKNGTLADGRACDVLIENGLIQAVAPSLSDSDAIVFDATSMIVMSGLVDLHTHLREPGKEDSETVLSASRAGSKGGFTALSAMPNTSPVADTAGVVEQVMRLGIEAGLCDVFPIGAVTKNLDGRELSEIGAMADSVARVSADAIRGPSLDWISLSVLTPSPSTNVLYAASVSAICCAELAEYASCSAFESCLAYDFASSTAPFNACVALEKSFEFPVIS